MTLSLALSMPKASYKNSYKWALIKLAPPYNAEDRAKSLAIPQLKDWEELLLSSDKVCTYCCTYPISWTLI